MEIRPIRTDADHSSALREIDRLWSFPDDSPENDKLDVLATLVEVYEKQRWPIDRPTPRDVLEYAVTDMGRSQKELGALLGSRSLASELLKGKRRISLDAAQKVSAAWSIPIQLLVTPYSLTTSVARTVKKKAASTAKKIKTKGAAEKIAAGLKESIAIARGEAKAARTTRAAKTPAAKKPPGRKRVSKAA